MDNQKSVKALRRDLYRGTFSLLVLALVAAFAIFSHLTIAWYANNKDVKADNTTITSASQSPNLFIRTQVADTPSDKDWMSAIKNIFSASETSPGLYPISTINCSDWYYINGWTLTYGDAENGVVKGKYEPTTYAAISVPDTGLYTAGGKTYRAFYKTEYNIYTDKDSLNIYFAPDNQINVVYTPSAIGGVDRRLAEAIRVGLVFGTNDPIIFAPAAEEVGGFKAVTGTTTVSDASSIVKLLAGLDEYKATANGDYLYNAGTTSLGTADPNGTKLTVYVWLEGTDNQALVNVSDGEDGSKGGLSVNLSIVGVEPTS